MPWARPSRGRQFLQSRLWFERLYAWMGLPLWAGVLLLGYIPFVGGLALGYLAAGLWTDFASQFWTVALPVSLSLIASAFAAVHICHRIERLGEYARSMIDGEARIELGSLYDSRKVFILWALTLLGVSVLYVVDAPPGYSAAQILLTQFSSWPIFQLYIMTTLWVWAFAMYAIYRMGRLPLKLRPFTEDPMLGLRPFARASLRFVAIYEGLVAIIAFPQILSGAYGLPVSLFLVGLFVLGIVFFLLPLIPLRWKLQAAKSEQSRWIGSEYSKLMQSVHTIDGDVDDKLVGRLMAIDKIQRDVRQIRTWPFEAGILARLIAVIVSITAIILSQILARLLNV